MNEDNRTVFTIDDVTVSIAKMSDLNDDWNTAGRPIYNDVKHVQSELYEQELRTKHPDLAKAYEDYTILLKKYGFWEKITK
tara:strand:+ start:87 stop:329 length:243 start_codon:yes stop_codon:yes gene_type:complete